MWSCVGGRCDFEENSTVLLLGSNKWQKVVCIHINLTWSFRHFLENQFDQAVAQQLFIFYRCFQFIQPCKWQMLNAGWLSRHVRCISMYFRARWLNLPGRILVYYRCCIWASMYISADKWLVKTVVSSQILIFATKILYKSGCILYSL